ncbi:unnamed protein product, partial [Tilletia caries]
RSYIASSERYRPESLLARNGVSALVGSGLGVIGPPLPRRPPPPPPEFPFPFLAEWNVIALAACLQASE